MPAGRPPNNPNNANNANNANSQSQISSNQASMNNSSGQHHSSVYPIDSVIDVADSLGIPSLKPQIASALASDVEYRLRQVAQEAAKFMRHAKRSQLKTTDVDAALRASNIEPIYGFLPTSAGRSTVVNSQNPSYAGPSFRRVQTSSGPVHVVDDQEIDFEQVLSQGGVKPKLKFGQGVGWGAHWLAVEGTQPAIPENPSPLSIRDEFSSMGVASSGLNGATASSSGFASSGGAQALLNSRTNSAPSQGVVARPLIKHVLSRELQLYYERLTAAITRPPAIADEDVEEDEDLDQAAQGSTLDAQGDTSMASANGSTSKSKGKGRWTSSTSATASAQAAAESKKVLKSFSSRSSGNTVRDAALASLRGDPGLHQLVPYLVQWVGEKVTATLSSVPLSSSGSNDPTQKELEDRLAEKAGENADALAQMMNVVHALLINPHLYIEPYLHQLLPSILSVLLTSSLSTTTKLLGPSPTTLRLRSHAASLLGYVLHVHGSAYPTLRPRIVKTLLGALLVGCPPLPNEGTLEEAESTLRNQASDSEDDGPRPSPGTKLGAILGLKSIGVGAIRKLLDSGKNQIDRSSAPGDLDDEILRSSPLARIGRWLDSWEKEKGEEESRAMVEQIKRSLYALVPPLVLPSKPEVVEKESSILKARYGSYWVGKLSGDPRARRALALKDQDLEDVGIGESSGDAPEARREVEQLPGTE